MAKYKDKPADWKAGYLSASICVWVVVCVMVFEVMNLFVNTPGLGFFDSLFRGVCFGVPLGLYMGRGCYE